MDGETSLIIDRIRLRAVCESWLSVPIQYIQPHKLPWIMNYCFSTAPTVCSLSEPCRKLLYIIKDKTVWSLLSSAKVCLRDSVGFFCRNGLMRSLMLPFIMSIILSLMTSFHCLYFSAQRKKLDKFCQRKLLSPSHQFRPHICRK